MKNNLIISLLPFALMAAACGQSGNGTGAFTTESASFSDSTAHAALKSSVEVPVATDKATEEIRKALLETYRCELEGCGFDEDYTVKVTGKQSSSLQETVDRFCKEAYSQFSKEADSDFDDRVSGLDRSSFDSDEEYQECIENMSGWECRIDISLIGKSDRYAVFKSQNYGYYGGAHGGIAGSGPLTYDLSTGELVTDFIKEGSEAGLQDILMKGVRDYMADNDESVELEKMNDVLMTDDGTVPIPTWTPYPTDKGLTFIYLQYEVLPYVFGMPEFTVPYDEIKPFLTQKALDLLGLEQ